MSDEKSYIGVDLGAWYGNKTRIAVLKKIENKLELVELINETKLTESWNSCNIDEKNRLLVGCLKKQMGNSGVIGIDAPFAIPFYLHNKLPETAESKPSYNLKEGSQKELRNPVLFDNSARFVFNITNQIVLAPAGDKIGKLTARMVKIVEQFSSPNELNIVRTPKFDRRSQISTIEVFPTATIYQIAKFKSQIGNYFKTKKDEDNEVYTEEFDENKKLAVQSYKGDNWNGKKNEEGKTTVESQKWRMIKLIKLYLNNSIDELINKIENDDDYDAIICALTVYLIDKNGYETPKNESDLDKFTNSFIYIPRTEVIRPE